jgi:pullulanase/glycogen debranching enzyme
MTATIKPGAFALWGGMAALCVLLSGVMAKAETVAPPPQSVSEARPSIRAEMRSSRAVWAITDAGERSLDPGDWRIERFDGVSVPIAQVLPHDARASLIVPAQDLDLKASYRLFGPDGSAARIRPDGWFRTLYSPKALGANVAEDGSETIFRVFAPRADGVKLYLYSERMAEAATRTIDMKGDSDGVFEAIVPGDLHGTWYTFTVHGQPGPARFYYETTGLHISDPYGRVYDEESHKSRVWRATEPSSGVKGGRPPMESVVAYEVHVVDFADLLPVPEPEKGTFVGFGRSGLVNARGEPIGIDHLAELGVNVVHFLPIQEYLHYPAGPWKARFGDDPLFQKMGIAEENYQWGYRTSHAFAVEGNYRVKGTEPGAERDQFRDLVQALHDRGIAVIIDLVPNHTAENMDSRDGYLHFSALDRDYFYRLDDSGAMIGPFGNEVKTEERPMTARWLLDQMQMFVNEFGIDGFRIDLAGQIDQQTLIWVKGELPQDLIIYGEPWIDVSDPIAAANPDWDWYKEDAPITFFQDSTRDALVGSPFLLEVPARDRGYAGGNTSLRDRAFSAIANAWPEEAEDVNLGLNYLDIHDNWTLADRFALTDWNGLEGVDQAPYRLAAGYLFTSLGPIVLHGGSEVMRSKGLAPIDEIRYETDFGPIDMKGRHDTYNLRTPNHFVWDDIGNSEGPNDYKAMMAWWQGLIAFRMSELGAPLRVGGKVPEGYVQPILPRNQALLGYVVDGRILVLSNVGNARGEFANLPLSAGQWRMIADGRRVDMTSAFEGPFAKLEGRARVLVPPQTMMIWVRD